MTDYKADILTKNLVKSKQLKRLDLYLKGFNNTLAFLLLTITIHRASKLTDQGVEAFTNNLTLSNSITMLRIDLEGHQIYLNQPNLIY